VLACDPQRFACSCRVLDIETMQSFPFWHAGPTAFELAQLAAAESQARWAEIGVYTQAAAALAAGIAIVFSYRAAQDARRQVGVARAQLYGEHSARAADSLVAAGELLQLIRALFSNVQYAPEKWTLDRAGSWCLRATWYTRQPYPALPSIDDKRIEGLRLAARILQPGVTQSWFAAIDAFNAVNLIAEVMQDPLSRGQLPPLAEILPQIEALRSAVYELDGIVEYASRNIHEPRLQTGFLIRLLRQR
jgi:hypothetical protein